MSKSTKITQQKSSTPVNRDTAAAHRVQIALQLRATRMTYEKIAQQAGYSNASAARKAIKRELERCVVRDVELLRNEECASLDQLEQEAWKRLYDKSNEKAMLFAIDRIIQIKERRAKLLGLDTPVDQAKIANMVVIREVPSQYLGLKPEEMPQ